MSNHFIEFRKDLVSSFGVILLIDKQKTDRGENITFLVEVISCVQFSCEKRLDAVRVSGCMRVGYK